MAEDLRHMICPNTLNRLYFSDKNTAIIQNAIRKNIYDQSYGKYLIDNQSKRELSIIMRSIYLQYSKNQNNNITKQIETLNTKVVMFSVKSIMTKVKQFISYKQNIDKLPIPMNHPTNMSNQGEKTLNSFQY